MPTLDDRSTFDRHLVTQVGLDSGALTRLGVVVHNEPEPGEYRGSVQVDDRSEGTFSVSVDRASTAAQVDIDLSALGGDGAASPGCCGDHGESGHRFVVHPRGHLVFRVGSGPGGHHVTLRGADEDEQVLAYDTRQLQEGDVFSAMVLRPGTYKVRNELSGARAALRVAYPSPVDGRYNPAPPFEVQCGERIEPDGIDLAPMQGINVHITAPARVRIDLVEPDDGPQGPRSAGRPGWRKQQLG